MTDYCPGAVQSPQPGGVALDTSLPPRVVWHITWDALTNGRQPDPTVVSNYLKSVEYCPHLMWNPFTGDIEQYYPASVGGRALKFNNQDGAACIQIEVFFTPGCVVNGVTYNTVAETPCIGLDTILAWTDSLGIPRVWPMGAPQWTGNSRDVGIWNGNAGHYGHCNSPGDDHTDPGPMPSLDRGAAAIGSQSSTITPQEDTLSAAEVKEIKDHIGALLVYGYTSGGVKHPGIAAVVEENQRRIAGVPFAVWSTPIPRGDTSLPVIQELADAKTVGFQNKAAIAALAGKPGAAIDVKALAAELAPLLTTNQAHELIVALGQALTKE